MVESDIIHFLAVHLKEHYCKIFTFFRQSIPADDTLKHL